MRELRVRCQVDVLSPRVTLSLSRSHTLPLSRSLSQANTASRMESNGAPGRVHVSLFLSLSLSLSLSRTLSLARSDSLISHSLSLYLGGASYIDT